MPTFNRILLAAVTFAQDPIVNIASVGKIIGRQQKSYGGKDYFSFEGIPYAHPPIGYYRFKEPRPRTRYPNPINATHLRDKCLQYAHLPETKVLGKEDCLYLNIYTPTLEPSSNYDVIIHIHGGAFMFSTAGEFLPGPLMDRKVVYAAIDYRLGPFGFISTEDSVVPGNMGIKDQILAVEWIKRYCRHFGGNPDSITLYGMSAGGASVHTLTLTPLAKGLFHRAFSQSGTALCNWALMENPLDATKRLAAAVSCNQKDHRAMVECMIRVKGADLVDKVKLFQPWLYNPFSPFAVTVDGPWAKKPVLPNHPYMLLKNDMVATPVPFLFSRVSGEGLYPGMEYYRADRLREMASKWEDISPHLLHYNFTVDPFFMKDVTKKIKEYYFPDNNIGQIDSNKYHSEIINQNSWNTLIKICYVVLHLALLLRPAQTTTISHYNTSTNTTLFNAMLLEDQNNLMSDRLFNVDIRKAAKLQAEAMKDSVFHYLFDYRGEESLTTKILQTKVYIGVSHGDDTGYMLFFLFNSQSSDDDKKMTQIMTDLLVNFAATGVPMINAKNANGKDFKIPPLSRNEPLDPYLIIKSPSDLKVAYMPFVGGKLNTDPKYKKDYAEFWESLPILENNHLFRCCWQI